jgi:hypothetical protein
MSSVLHQAHLFSGSGSQVVGSAVSELGPRHSRNKENVIAVTDGLHVIEYSLKERAVRRIIDIPVDMPVLSLTYLNNIIVVSVD